MYQIITNIISATILCVAMIICGEQLFNNNINIKKIQNILVAIIFIVFLILNAYMENQILKIAITYLMLAAMYKVIYNENNLKTLSMALISYLLIFASEFIVGMIISLLSNIFNTNIMDLLANTILTNFLVSFNVILLLRVITKRKIRIFEYLDKMMFFLYLLIFIILTLISKKINLSNWTLNYDLFINISIIAFLLFVTAIILYQKSKYNKIKDNYIKVSEYSSVNDEELEEYRLKNHEFKNELVIIKGMAKEKKYKQLIEYLDMLSDKNQNVKYSWVGQIKNIKLSGLKGLLNYKIIDFMNQDIKMEIIISKEVKDFDFSKFTVKELDNLYSLVGVYLDNAFDAAKESEERKMAINAYMEEESFVLMIANTYDTSKDLSRIDEYKYTTKGKNHGVGLYLASKILKEDKNFKVTRQILQEFFIQTLTIYKK